jgi:hypothetical protein
LSPSGAAQRRLVRFEAASWFVERKDALFNSAYHINTANPCHPVYNNDGGVKGELGRRRLWF